ncbi:MAG: Flp family type IVb pilin [Candidatus Vogelbacteria bacterium]|nr:Flp family type IVb pilin [Candidatus Vogelbacteria bacterium]
MITFRKARKTGETGQGLVEYALILATIAVVAIGVMSLLGVKLSVLLGRTADAIAPLSSEESAPPLE